MKWNLILCLWYLQILCPCHFFAQIWWSSTWFIFNNLFARLNLKFGVGVAQFGCISISCPTFASENGFSVPDLCLNWTDRCLTHFWILILFTQFTPQFGWWVPQMFDFSSFIYQWIWFCAPNLKLGLDLIQNLTFGLLIYCHIWFLFCAWINLSIDFGVLITATFYMNDQF